MPLLNVKTGDSLVIDAHIERIPGEYALYIKKGGDETKECRFGLYSAKTKKGFKCLGMITHILHRTYKSTNEILSAEILIESEDSQ